MFSETIFKIARVPHKTNTPVARPYVAGMRANVPPRRGGATGVFMIF